MVNRAACPKLRQLLIGAIIVSQFMPTAFAGEPITNEKLQEILGQHFGGRNEPSSALHQVAPAPPLNTAENVEAKREAEMQRLHEAAHQGNVETVKKYLDEGSDINAKDPIIPHNTPLMIAVLKNKEELVKFLISRGADVNGVNDFGTSVLSMSVEAGNPSIVRALLEARANPYSTNAAQFTPLIEAANKGSAEIVKVFVEKGVDMNTKSAHGFTALDFALQKGNASVIQILKSAGGRGNPIIENNYLESGSGAYAAADPSMPEDVLARIKADIQSRYPTSYSTQELLVEQNKESWKRLQRNFTSVPDAVFFQIRDNIATRYPDSYSTQETLVKAEAESWKKLNR